MTTYYCWHGGSNGDGLSWANAKTTLASALALATASGDIVLVDKSHTGDNAMISNTTWGPPATNTNASIICVDKTAGDAPALMGTSAWLGSSNTNNYTHTFSPTTGGVLYVYGVTVRSNGSGGCVIKYALTDGGQLVLDNVTSWLGTGGTGRVEMGAGSNGRNTHVSLNDCTFLFGHTGQKIGINTDTKIIGGGIDSGSAAISTVFTRTGTIQNGTSLEVIGFDMSAAGTSAKVYEPSGDSGAFVRLHGCLMPPGATVTFVGGDPNLSAGNLLATDCTASGVDFNAGIALSNALGYAISSLGTGNNYLSDGAQSPDGDIVVMHTAGGNATAHNPFYTPWVDVYLEAGQSMQPYIECLRMFGTDALTDNEAWIEVLVKDNAGSVLPTKYTDKCALLGTPTSQPASAKTSTDWHSVVPVAPFVVGLDAPVTAAESGLMRVRLGVASAYLLIYDPQVRDAS